MSSNKDLVKAAMEKENEMGVIAQKKGFHMIVRTIARSPVAGAPGAVTADWFSDYVSVWMDNGWKVQNAMLTAQAPNTIEVMVFLVKQE